jgi:uncharacterized pyridoxamine 5'-phosphate oxidase family protein
MLYKKETPDFTGKEVFFGLNERSTNDDIKRKAFALIREVRTMPAATVTLNGMPDSRVIDFCILSDDNIYFIGSKGKSFHKQLVANPVIVLNVRIGRWSALRLSAQVKIVSNDKKVWDEFFLYNKGTASMYSTNMKILDLFKLEKGEGELFQLVEDEKLKRARFAFGGTHVRPWNYKITDTCDGCGLCQEACREGAIVKDANNYKIVYMECNECGKCYVACPTGAISCVLYDVVWHDRMMESKP